jgi:hypothetical protein
VFVLAALFKTDFSKANVVTSFPAAVGEGWQADVTATGDCVGGCTALLWVPDARAHAQRQADNRGPGRFSDENSL